MVSAVAGCVADAFGGIVERVCIMRQWVRRGINVLRRYGREGEQGRPGGGVPDRPNLLFLMSDEHRADVTGYEGNDVIRTRRLDYLAERGVVFRNAYAPAPICIPGRQCMMAGQLPLTCHCLRFGDDLSPGYMTFARRFAQYAYATVAAGKLHHTGVDQMQGWTQRIGADMQVGVRHIPDRDLASFERYHLPPASDKWSDVKEILRAGVGRGPCIERDEYALAGALGYLATYFNDPDYDRARGSQPLLLKVSFVQPHYPYFTSEGRFNYYLNRVRPFVGQQVSDHPFLSQHQVRLGVDLSEREIRRATAAYYGMVETVDDYFGQVLDFLSELGQNLDDWIIIYTSDHGEMLGEHGVWEKQKFYEGSVRVPLIICWPRGFSGGRVVEENVNLCDLFTTLCELVEIPTPPGLDSRSLVPLLKGYGADWDDESISQFTHRGGTNVMIKRGHLKYQYYPGMPEVLFDLKADPGERYNYVDDPAYSEAVAAFRRRLGEIGD